MGIPNHPVTLTPEEITELNVKLADMRHNVNNYLSLMVAAVELMRRKPDLALRFVDALAEPPQKITDEVKRFSNELEKVLQITRL